MIRLLIYLLCMGLLAIIHLGFNKIGISSLMISYFIGLVVGLITKY
jgi:hypothetical protein